MNKFYRALILLLGLAFLLTGCTNSIEQTEDENIIDGITIVDDSGNTITIKEPAKRIISLYSAHTENLYELGLDDEIIGRGTSDIYPVQVLEKNVYDYRSDPEKVIAAEPDLVIIRPFIERKSPEFVEILRKVGIPVVSLYPESFSEFDEYIMKLGKLTGKEDVAKKKLDSFYLELDKIKEKTKDISPKIGIYFEATQTEYRTVTKDSMPGIAIEIAGGVNVAGDLEPMTEGSSIASFGVERILEKSDEIQVYVSQRGAMNAGGNYHTISIRPGFDTIKAVKEQRVYMINQKIISSPTFRYVKGIKELTRMFYPEIFNDYSAFNNESLITREEYAELIVKYTNREVFVPTSKYYNKTYNQHTYAFFKDVKVEDPKFDMIETAVLAGYLDGYKEDGVELFYPKENITRDQLAKTLILLSEFRPVESKILIEDLSNSENQRVVQLLVDNNILKLEDGYFNPSTLVKGNEIIEILSRINQYKIDEGL